VEQRSLSGPHGAIPVRIYRATAPTGTPSPALVWAHGGAFAWGDLDMPEAEWVAEQLAERGVTVVSVDYRLAPITASMAAPGEQPRDGVRFPLASDEVVAAFTWTIEHAAELAIDTARVSLGGASAGGNLAAGAALRLRDTAGPRPATITLAYPHTHGVLPQPTSELAAKIAALPPEARFDPGSVRTINVNYVGDPAGLDNPYAFPGGHDLAGLPPAFIVNSDHDSLRSSGEAFAAELASAGIDVAVVREPGTRHGHLNEPLNPAAHTSIERMAAWLNGSALFGPH
jgi:acetyl esterase